MLPGKLVKEEMSMVDVNDILLKMEVQYQVMVMGQE